MSFLIGLFTGILVLDCIVLILLVLVQLPKKDAGAGMAFGGGTADALFGAGSGNALTKITKWAAGMFFALAIVLSMLSAHVRRQQSTVVLPKNWESGSSQPAAATPPPAPASTPLSFVAPTNEPPATPEMVEANLPPAVSTNAPAAP